MIVDIIVRFGDKHPMGNRFYKEDRVVSYRQSVEIEMLPPQGSDISIGGSQYRSLQRSYGDRTRQILRSTTLGGTPAQVAAIQARPSSAKRQVQCVLRRLPPIPHSDG